MRILAIETSGFGGSVAAVDDRRILVEQSLPPAQRTAQSLVPAMDSVLKRAAWKPADVQLIAVAKGPGSFTGLRIGLTVAKTFAYATCAPILGVSTLEVLAHQSAIEQGRVWSILNAERKQLFTACFERSSDGWIESGPATILDISQWLERLVGGDYVIGPPLTELNDRIPADVRIANQELWLPTAASVAVVACSRFKRGQRDEPLALFPDYLRDSAATEKASQSSQGE